jgi:hypothetical protein
MRRYLRFGTVAAAVLLWAAGFGATPLAASECAATANDCSPTAVITTSHIQIGGEGSLSYNGLPFSDPGRLDDGTVAEADLEFTFDRSTGRLTLVAMNQTASTASLTAIGFNTAPEVTGMALVSHTGSLPWELAFDLDRTDSVVDTHPSLNGLKMDGFGRQNVFIGNKGIDTGGNGGDATEIQAGQSVTFEIQVAGDPNDITACSFTSVGSFIPPGDKIVTAVGRFQAGEQGGSGFIGPCGPGDLLVTLASFDALPGASSVTLLWETASEVENAGFAILRKDVRTRTVERLNPTLIPPQGSPVSGAFYAFVDTTALDGKKYLYSLEDWDIHSVNNIHPPKRAVPNPPRPPIRLLKPGYEEKAESVVRLKWEADGKRRCIVEISADATFPADGTMRIHVGSRSTRTLTSRELSKVETIAAAGGEGGVYWRVSGREAKRDVARSQTFFLVVD